MTQDEIIEMARQAGDVLTDSRGRMDFCFDNYGLEAFAKLVAQEVRDRIMFGSRDDWVLAEREACAKVAEEGLIGHTIAKAIRARGEQA